MDIGTDEAVRTTFTLAIAALIHSIGCEPKNISAVIKKYAETKTATVNLETMITDLEDCIRAVEEGAAE